MTPRILIGDAREALKELPEASVDCVVTSPPYYSLRDYGVDGQIGREPTLAGYIEALVAVFREVGRVLKPEGTAWLNLGDCYASASGGAATAGSAKQASNHGAVARERTPAAASGIRPKNLMLVPARVAIALQDDGWYVRSEVVWGKPNPMPESVKDRPSTAHEHIWMLSRAPRHFYDNGAGQVPIAESTTERAQNGGYTFGSAGNPDRKDGGNLYAPKPVGPNGFARRGREHRDGTNTDRAGKLYGEKDVERRGRRVAGLDALHAKQAGHGPRHDGFNGRWQDGEHSPTRRLRNYEEAPLAVWRFSPAQYAGAHFAVFPPELVERCLAVGCPEGGTVLDPFGGSGTVGLVAQALGYESILVELNPEYAQMARERIASGGRMDTELRRQHREASRMAALEERGQERLL